MEYTEKEKLALRISFWTGAIIGLVLALLYSLAFFSELTKDASIALTITILAAISIVQIATAIAGTAAFTYLFVRWKVKRWLSFPIGIALGAIGAGISGGLTFGTLFAIAVPTGAIEMSHETLVWVDTWLEAFWLGLKGGGVFGSMTGICIGVVYGPILSFSLKYK